MKEAYSWWATQFVEGFRDKIDDRPREGEAQRTIVILAVRADDPLPKRNDAIYFEIPVDIGQIQSLRAEGHMFVFRKRPASPQEGLRSLGHARKSFWCRTVGLENEQGGRELQANWFVDQTSAELKQAPRPFRRVPQAEMQQVGSRSITKSSSNTNTCFLQLRQRGRRFLTISPITRTNQKRRQRPGAA
jgi:hypothetical protein